MQEKPPAVEAIRRLLESTLAEHKPAADANQHLELIVRIPPALAERLLGALIAACRSTKPPP